MTVQGPVDGFRFEFQPSGATLCVLIPAEQTSPAACAGVEVDSLRARLAWANTAMLVRRGDERYLVTYEAHSPMSGMAWGKGVDDDLRSRYPGMHISSNEDDLVNHRRVGTAEVLRRDDVVSLRNMEPIESLHYVIPGKRASHLLMVEEDESLATVARRDLDVALGTLHVEISVFAKIWLFAEKLAVVLAGAALLGALFAGYVVFKKRSGRAA